MYSITHHVTLEVTPTLPKSGEPMPTINLEVEVEAVGTSGDWGVNEILVDGERAGESLWHYIENQVLQTRQHGDAIDLALAETAQDVADNHAECMRYASQGAS